MKKIFLSILFGFFVMVGFGQNSFIAHRGASYLAPENTVASAEKAWELEAEAVEVDVHLSKDKRVMVIHDKDTKRTCSGKTKLVVQDTPSTLLRDLDAGVWKDEEFAGEKIPFLEEIIATVPSDRFLVVEIKCGSEIIPELRRCIDKSGKEDQIVFISFDWDVIVNTQKEFRENKCYWLSGSKSGLKKKMAEAQREGLTGVNLNHSIINEDVVKMADEHQLEVLTYTVDDPTEARRLIMLGVNKITTNRPKWLKDELAGL